ncbi:Nucleophosmin, partial [Chelonia mydas]
VSLGAGAKDELHVIEAEALDYEGNPIKVTLASLKMSVQPTVLSASGSSVGARQAGSLPCPQCAPGWSYSSDDDDDLDEEEEEKIPMKKPARDLSAKSTPKSKQNGKDSKPSTPASKSKTPASNKKENKPQSPKSPKVPLSLEEIKAKMQATIEKGSALPKMEAKFVNYVKNCFRTQDQKVTEFTVAWKNPKELL